jgi:Secretion system C-terminal sorting domain
VQSEISKLAFWLSNKCDVKLGNYQTAVSWYENIIDNPESENDSSFAIIDLGYVYILMEDSSQRQNIACRHPEYNIGNRKEYSDYRDELLDGLWNSESATAVEKNKINKNIDLEVLSIYPNPANDHFMINFELKKDAKLNVRIYDNAGRLVLDIGSKTFTKGENNIQVDCSNYPKGIYNCMLSIDGKNTIHNRFVKQ